MPLLHEIWPSNNRYYCGCCIAGPANQWPGIVCIHCCSILILIPFCVFVAKQNLNTVPALPILFFISATAMFILLYLTACIDPGIIPRRPFLQRHPEEHHRYLSLENPRQCTTCFIGRPSKAGHCRECNNCVQVFDHHCGVIGTCIAKRNYRYFIGFLGTVMLSIVLLVVNMVFFVISKTQSQISSTAVIVIASVLGGVLGLPLLGFFGFHLYLAITRKTTRDILKKFQSDPNAPVENQWCDVDPPILDLFQQISQEQAHRLKQELEKMSKPIVPSEKVVQKNTVSGNQSEMPLV